MTYKEKPVDKSSTSFLQVILPIETVSEANRRDHHMAKARRVKMQRRAACMVSPAFPLPCVVRLVRASPRPLDDDNLRAALKAVRDGIADRLGIDDRDPRCRWEYAQVQRKGKGTVLVEFMAMEKEPAA